MRTSTAAAPTPTHRAAAIRRRRALTVAAVLISGLRPNPRSARRSRDGSPS
jgi:hypothetical protein